MDRAAALYEWTRERMEALDHRLPAAPSRPTAVVVGVDGSAESRHAVAWAASIAPEIHLVCGMHAYLGPGGGPVTPAMARVHEEAMAAEAAAAIEDVRVAALDAKVHAHVVHNTPARAITALAARTRAPLVLVGATGKGRVERLLLGSVSEGLAHDGDRPVLVARREPRPGPVVVGAGDDPGSAEAARLGAALAGWTQRPLVLAHAAPEDAAFPRFEGDGPDAKARLVRHPARQGLPPFVERERAALLVVGPGRTPGWLGSTAVAVVRRAPCSVLLARPHADA